MVGRPKEFDERQALEQAMTVFWTHGYQATSVQDLLDAMGINRGSMYDTFGDKHALFSAAIDHYGRTVTRGLEDTLAGPGSPMANIRKALLSVADQVLDRPCRGCMATNTAIELAQHDPQAGAAVTNIMQRIEKAFRGALQRSVEAGELGPQTNTRALGRFLTGTLQGIVVMGKASSSRATLRDIVTVALAALQ